MISRLAPHLRPSLFLCFALSLSWTRPPCMPGILCLSMKLASLFCSCPWVSQAVEVYQELWECLEDMDENAWVLQPTPQGPPVMAARDRTTQDLGAVAGAAPRLPYGGSGAYRRLALARHCSVSLRLSARTPRGVPPDVQFLGPPAVVGPLQHGFFQGLSRWDDSRCGHAELTSRMAAGLGRWLQRLCMF